VPSVQTGPLDIKELKEAGQRAGATSPDDFEERSSILEFEGGYSRQEAERLALIECGMVEGGKDA
ncbi:MAG: hypothetical protein AAGI28_16095, partial [Pseudomonadota bacterium]